MIQTSNAAGVQRAAQQFCLRRELRMSGAFMVVFGTLALLGGLLPPTDLALLAVGVVLFAAAVTNLAMPSPAGLAFSGAAFMLVGAYNIVSTILVARSGTGGGSAGMWPVIGAWQIIWGLQAIGRFRRYPSQEGPVPSESELAQAAEWVTALRKARVKDETDVIEVTNRNAFDPKRARVRLMPAQAVVLVNFGQDARVVSADRFTLTPAATSGNARMVAVALKAGDFALDGVLSQDHMARYQQWKQAAAPLRAEPLARAA